MFLGLPHLQMVGWGVFIASLTLLVVGQKQQLLSTGTPNSPVRTRYTQFIVWCLPRQPTIGVCSNRPLDPTVTQTIRCIPDNLVLQPESARCGLLYVDCPGVPPNSPVHTR
jgi:hypothetical protein